MAVKYTSFVMAVNGGALIDMKAVRSLEGRCFSGSIEADSAADAMSRLRLVEPERWRGTAFKAPPGLTLISAKLSDMDPFELCQLVKLSYPAMFMALVADAGSLPALAGRMPGTAFDELLVAPFSAEELAARVELLLNRHVRATKAIPPKAPPAPKPAPPAPPPGPPPMPQPGDVLDRFYIVETLKAGPGAAVYKAIDKEANSLCALKALFGKALLDASSVDAFEREGAAMSRISHQNVLSCFARGEACGIKYIVSEWIDGPSLEDYLLVRGAPPLESFFKVAREMAFGLKAIHQEGLVHRDISLANVLLRKASNEAVIADLGIAVESSAPSVKTHLEPGFVEGSRLYLAPELLSGGKADLRSDIYSYGAVLFHFLTGCPPQRNAKGGSASASLRVLRPEAPECLESLLAERCMAAAPSLRPDSMDAVLSALAACENELDSAKANADKAVLIVDDEPAALDALARLLRNEPYTLLSASSAEKALEIMEGSSIDLLLADCRMPGMSGLELAQAVRERHPDAVRIVFGGQCDIEAGIGAVNSGCIYKYIVNSWFRDDLRQGIRQALDYGSLQARKRKLDTMLASNDTSVLAPKLDLSGRSKEAPDEAKRRLEAHCEGLFTALFMIMELYSSEMARHGRRVGFLGKELALAAGAKPELAAEIEMAGCLHDIGKMLLGFESGGRRLSKEEEAHLERRHPSLGAKILASVPALAPVAAMLRSHHEHYDGKGLPDGLSGEAISYGARILAIADRFDRLAWMPETGIARRRQFVEEAIIKLSGLELDPFLLKIFLSEISSKAYTELYAQSERQAKSG